MAFGACSTSRAVRPLIPISRGYFLGLAKLEERSATKYELMEVVRQVVPWRVTATNAL